MIREDYGDKRSIERRISYIDRTTWPPTINFTRTFSKDTIFKTINSITRRYINRINFILFSNSVKAGKFNF